MFAEPLLHRRRVQQIKLMSGGFDLLVEAARSKARLMALPAIPGNQNRKAITSEINVIPELPTQQSPYS